ncbi:MAG: zinc ribbon domain-containing protein [Clostridia bacterium]|nr:zinc ribbon domain-containing protein [Clostridia bacterium]
MAFCINCGQELADGAKFCANCGKAVNDSNSSEQRKTVYDGVIHKCPNCGERLDSFVTNCPACGYELRGTKATSCVNDLAQKLERSESIEQKVDLIRNFYIPNTKEDIYEFFILATSNINAGGYDVEAWYAKLEQAYQKAKLSFGKAPEFEYLSQLYSKAKKQQRANSLTRSIKKSKMLQCLLLGALGAILMVIGFFGGSLSGDSDSPFYMIAMIGLFPIIGAGIYAMSSAEKDKKYDNDKDE